MLNLCCCCFFGRSQPMREALLPVQRQIRYAGVNYHIPEFYEFENSKYFYSFLYENPMITDVCGGWKVHISLDAENIENIARAWSEIIVPELLTCGIREFKITTENHLGKIAAGAEGQGKLITFYLRHNPELGAHQSNHRHLIEMFNKIESRLIQAEIEPGARPNIDRVIQNSRYMSFRCDALMPDPKTPEGRAGVVYALPDDQAPNIAVQNGTDPFNPFNLEDEYGLFDLDLGQNFLPVYNRV